VDPLRRIARAQKFALARELRARATPAERFAWSLLRNRGLLGLKFRRQHVIRGFIVDFCCLEAGIVLELDGRAHDAEPERGYDMARGAVLKGAGFQVLRVANRDVNRDHLERLLRTALKNSHFVPPLRNGEGVRG
jgi:very-short-patch-repair endonuclease